MGERLQRWKDLVARHKILSTLLAIYLALSTVELVRILLYDRPREYDAGFYQWETVQLPEGNRTFHWTRGENAYILRPLWGPVVRIPFYLSHPEMPPEGVLVTLSMDERQVHELRLQQNGWHRLDLWLPVAMQQNPWRQTPSRMALEGAAELRPVQGEEPFREAVWTLEPVPDYVRVFTEWHEPPGPPSRWIELRAEPTFRPAEYLETDDDRELGVGVGELLWLRELPEEGIGFHDWERHPEGEFRWSRSWGSAPVAVNVPAAVSGIVAGRVPIRVGHPDVEARPVGVRLWWNTRPVAEVELADAGWHEVVFETETGDRAGVLTVQADRTWSPARAGLSADVRELGVAVGRVSWER